MVNKVTYIRAPLREASAVSGEPERASSVLADRIDRFPLDVPIIRRIVGPPYKLLRFPIELVQAFFGSNPEQARGISVKSMHGVVTQAVGVTGIVLIMPTLSSAPIQDIKTVT